MSWLRDNNTHVNSGVDMSDLIKTDNSKVIAQLESKIAELEKRLSDAETESTKEQSIRDLEQKQAILTELSTYAYWSGDLGDQAVTLGAITILMERCTDQAKALKEDNK